MPPPPAHTFHFLLEWAFHLHAELEERAVGRHLPHLLLLHPPASSRPTHLDAQKMRIYRALLRKAGAAGHLAVGNESATCISGRLHVGMAPEVSLIASSCRDLPSSSSPQAGRRSGKETVDDWWRTPLAAARRLTNCSLTRARLRSFRGFLLSLLVGERWRAEQQSSLPPSARAPRRILLVQRTVDSRRIAQLPAFASSLRRALRERLPAGTRFTLTTGDFTSDLVASVARIQPMVALVAVHGNALTNVLLAAPGGALRAVVQLVPDCLPASTLSTHAYEVLGGLVARHSRGLVCECTQPDLGKSSNVRCNATRLAGLLARAFGGLSANHALAHVGQTAND